MIEKDLLDFSCLPDEWREKSIQWIAFFYQIKAITYYEYYESQGIEKDFLKIGFPDEPGEKIPVSIFLKTIGEDENSSRENVEKIIYQQGIRVERSFVD